MLTYWAQLLHFYQPPTQTHEILERVTRQSYRPLLGVLMEHPEARVAVNMSAVLTQMLVEHGLRDVVDCLRGLAERGQVEFVGSGRYHPILPLIPESERRRSVTENAQLNREFFGSSYEPRGFFPPELCYSDAITDAVTSSGHEWLLLSGVACPGEWKVAEVARIASGAGQTRVLFRDDVRSNQISFRETTAAAFVAGLGPVARDGDAYVLTAMDAETYGHHIAGWEREFLAAAYDEVEKAENASVRMVQPSELLDLFPAGPVIEPHASSWSTTRDDIAAKNPYPLWHAPEDEVHALQWEYVEHCLDLFTTARRYAAVKSESGRFAVLAGDALQPALHSCQFWWASGRPMWDVAMVLRGLQLLTTVLVYATRSVEVGEAAADVKRQARWRVAAANEARIRLERLLMERTA